MAVAMGLPKEYLPKGWDMIECKTCTKYMDCPDIAGGVCTDWQEKKSFEFIPIAVTVLVEADEAQLINKLGTIAGVAYQADEGDKERRLLLCMNKGHESVFEHHSITVFMDCDRATTHALVRHRHCAFTQESTIYCNYNKKGIIRLIEPQEYADEVYSVPCNAYLKDTRAAVRKRDILPNCTKTTLVMTTNIREWRYILGLRSDPKDSGRMHTVIEKIREQLTALYPFFFTNIPQVWK